VGAATVVVVLVSVVDGDVAVLLSSQPEGRDGGGEQAGRDERTREATVACHPERSESVDSGCHFIGSWQAGAAALQGARPPARFAAAVR
jgi:hypothetical protein